MLNNDFFFVSIVSEDGASVYSASEEAAKELPRLDTSLRGAGNTVNCLSELRTSHQIQNTRGLVDCIVSFSVSIGRRLQDPLVELVKIEPKHLGIGMYQVLNLSFTSVTAVVRVSYLTLYWSLFQSPLSSFCLCFVLN